jgi:hypothetical protein
VPCGLAPRPLLDRLFAAWDDRSGRQALEVSDGP